MESGRKQGVIRMKTRAKTAKATRRTTQRKKEEKALQWEERAVSEDKHCSLEFRANPSNRAWTKRMRWMTRRQGVGTMPACLVTHLPPPPSRTLLSSQTTLTLGPTATTAAANS